MQRVSQRQRPSLESTAFRKSNPAEEPVSQLQPREVAPVRSCPSWARRVLQNAAKSRNHTVTPTKSFSDQMTALAADAWFGEQFFHRITSCHEDQLVQTREEKDQIL